MPLIICIMKQIRFIKVNLICIKSAIFPNISIYSFAIHWHDMFPNFKMLARCQFLKIVELFFLEVSVSGLEFEVKRYKYVMVKYSKAIRCLRLYYCYTEKCPCSWDVLIWEWRASHDVCSFLWGGSQNNNCVCVYKEKEDAIKHLRQNVDNGWGICMCSLYCSWGLPWVWNYFQRKHIFKKAIETGTIIKLFHIWTLFPALPMYTYFKHSWIHLSGTSLYFLACIMRASTYTMEKSGLLFTYSSSKVFWDLLDNGLVFKATYIEYLKAYSNVLPYTRGCPFVLSIWLKLAPRVQLPENSCFKDSRGRPPKP